MDVDELLRQTKINRVKSEQAIRRSKALVKGSINLVACPGSALGLPTKREAPRSIEIVREQAREAREKSRLVLQQSKAARERYVAFRNRLKSSRVTTDANPSANLPQAV